MRMFAGEGQPPQAKRTKHAQQPGAAAAKPAGVSGGYLVKMNLVPEGSSLVSVMASIPQNSSDATAVAFSGLMQQVESDIVQIL